ncbi:hypothetical protein KNP414_05026 [Paenibacillus mucilaginosus KNP414]|uniref:Uncharacterized protein n=2 Tax=Paenibacillus mucilaginosus TaxID=61624 RepID=F8F6N5_PAEMK|nr:hypothetical protein KNP414_05026 [Paenibacillus mucilaginosus KNP414]
MDADMKEKGFDSGSALWEVEAETRLPDGEESKTGRHTVVTLRGRGASAWVQVDKDADKVSYLIHSPDLVQVELFGDAAAEHFIEALEQAAESLRKQLKRETEKNPGQSAG